MNAVEDEHLNRARFLVGRARRPDHAVEAWTEFRDVKSRAIAEAKADERVQMRSMPASAITLVQRAISLAISALKSSGVPPLGSLPSAWMRSIITGSVRSALISLLSRAAIGAGSFAGPTRPIHDVTANPA